jgi:ABC-type glycerol-3-phosphate transport system substrate-binding protein
MRVSRVRSARWWLVASVLAVALAACGGGDDQDQATATTAAPGTTAAAGDAQTVQITVTGTKVETAERRVKVPLDGKVRL